VRPDRYGRDCDALVATQCSPTTAASTSSSTTPGARSAARSSSSFDRFHDFERTMQLNYFGALRLIDGRSCPR
jgi:hypothetical protein